MEYISRGKKCGLLCIHVFELFAILYSLSLPDAIVGRNYPGEAIATAVLNCALCLSQLCVALTTPFLIAIALKFKSWEMFLLAIIGISVCGTMCSGELPIKGWIVGFIGILIAMVGIDPIYGVERYTFDNPNLYDGFSYIPILIGLFGICEIIKTLPNEDKSPIPKSIGKLFLPFSILNK